MMTERASVARGHNGLATPGTRFAARGSPRDLLGLGALLERVRRRTHKTMQPRSVTTHPPASGSVTGTTGQVATCADREDVPGCRPLVWQSTWLSPPRATW